MKLICLALALGVALAFAGCKCGSGPAAAPIDDPDFESPDEGDEGEARAGSRDEDRRPARVEEPGVEEEEAEDEGAGME